MPLTAKELKISFNMDEFTWGDLEDLRRGRLLDVCERLATIEGVEKKDVRKTLCKLAYLDIKQIDTLLSQAIEGMSNPDDGSGKN